MSPTLDLSFAPQKDLREVVVRFGTGGRELGQAHFRCRTGHSLRPAADALFCLGLYPASELGSGLRIAAGADPILVGRACQITSLFRSWWPPCKVVSVPHVSGEAEPLVNGRGTALYFSGGVDSSFSLLDARPRLSSIITLLGVDVPLSDAAGNDRLEAMCRAVALANGLEPIVIETDVAQVFHPFASWIEHHGSVLAAIGHLLTDHLERVLIASSGDETSWLAPWGSHPALDPLFSSRRLQVEHHGLVPRFDKIARTIGDPVLMGHLRVCNRARFNCGSCDKCAFAMRALEILEAEQQATTFPPFRPRRGGLRIVDDAFLSEMIRLQEAALETGHGDLVPEIDSSISAYRRRAAWQKLGAKRWRIWSRVMRHRIRWKRASS